MNNIRSNLIWPKALAESGASLVMDRTVVKVTGEAAANYLQGQLSQDIEAMPIGSSAYSFVLEPQGKISAWFRVTRLGENSFLLDTDAGFEEPLITRLERFKLSTPVQFEAISNAQILAVRYTHQIPAQATVPAQEALAGEAVLATIPVRETGYCGWDVLGIDLSIPTSLAPLPKDIFEALRIEAGIPAMGQEILSNTIPAATRMVERSVSFTKGCYTGQELVARMDSRGNKSPQSLVTLSFQTEEAPQVGDQIYLVHDENNGSRHEEAKPVGAVTSVAPLGSAGTAVALGYVVRAVELPAAVKVGTKELSAQSFAPIVSA
ncbi:MAG: hypothetical protein WC184_02455 [Acidimicrobiia bacterium]